MRLGLTRVLSYSNLIRKVRMATRRSARLQAGSPPSQSTMSQNVSIPKTGKRSKKRKGSSTTVPTEQDANTSTPKRKRVTKETLPPVTPTPAAVSLMSLPYSTGDIDDATPPPRNRLAIPEGTNAPLLTPEHHHLISNKALDQVSPSKVAAVKTTTTTILEQGIAHLLKTEPKLRPVIEKFHCHIFSPEGLAEEIDPFRALVSGIIAQQVSGAAAKAIKAKFISLFHSYSTASPTFPTPTQVLAHPIPHLRTAGLSQRKAEYIQGLAQKFSSGELTTSFLFSASYEEVLEELTKVRGLGKWSVEMFACFALKRMDVFSTGDLGVQRGMARLLGRDVEKLKKAGGKDGKKGGGKWKYLAEEEMLKEAERFRPYRSLFMWYMWRFEDVDVEALDKA